ncbi:MAG TPA: DUF6538 domain-containing protein [Pararhizobium sp.]|uniref:DUF6538 domain-containing protein n=1 Tax=Pararhizobium sp. TaxID=1977563 RepID=UPI002C048EB5|nr:DUF6538 domain-containing protein [Pararhizobium sp.]HTO31919.1 DUF6538 domain-containing protein [Pararhizobium sp.]
MKTLPERLMVHNSTFYCRMRVPRDLARTFCWQLVVISSRTKDLTTARSGLLEKLSRLKISLLPPEPDFFCGTSSSRPP